MDPQRLSRARFAVLSKGAACPLVETGIQEGGRAQAAARWVQSLRVVGSKWRLHRFRQGERGVCWLTGRDW